jgi:hypothetical protein
MRGVSSCAITKPTPAPVETYTEPQLKVQALFDKIPLNRPFPVEITVENAAPQEQIEVMLTGMPGFVPSLDAATLFADEHGAARLTLNATIEQAGYAMLIVNAEVSGERLSDTLDIVFDAPGVRTAALSVNASEEEGSSIELEAYFESLPRVSDARYVDWYEGDAELAPTSTNSADDLPETVVVEGVQYAHEDGSLTEPRWAVEHFVFDSGEGEPQPDDLSTTANEDTLQTQGCSRVSSYVTFRYTIDKGMTNQAVSSLPKGTLVRVVHHNPWPFGHTLLFEGYVGDYGRFDFTLPTCTPSGSDKVDPYFLIVGDSNIGLSMHNGFFNYLTEWRTGVYWDHDSNDLNNKMIWLDSSSAHSRLDQRVWYKVNRVYNWERVASNSTQSLMSMSFIPPATTLG